MVIMAGKTMLVIDVATLNRQLHTAWQREFTLERELEQARAVRQALDELRQSAVEINGTAQENSENIAPDKPQETPKLRPREALVALLGAHPEGLTRKEIVSALKGRIDTKSADIERLIYSTIYTTIRDKVATERQGRVLLDLKEGSQMKT
jgi:hypothetical protein